MKSMLFLLQHDYYVCKVIYSLLCSVERVAKGEQGVL